MSRRLVATSATSQGENASVVVDIPAVSCGHQWVPVFLDHNFDEHQRRTHLDTITDFLSFSC